MVMHGNKPYIVLFGNFEGNTCYEGANYAVSLKLLGKTSCDFGFDADTFLVRFGHF